MRVLAVLAALLAGGCFDPEIDDCQFRCGQNGSCPDGSSCRNGFCRNSSTNQCANDPCENAPAAPSGCGNRFALLDPNGCGVVCASNTLGHAEVQAACGPDWRAGILDSRTELDSVPVTQGRFWVGAERVSTIFQWFSGAPVDPTAWDTSFPTSAESCVYLEGSRRRLRNDRTCEDDLNYICTYPATN